MLPLSRRRLFALSAASAALAIPRPLLAALPPSKTSFAEHDLDVLDAIKRVVYGPGADSLDIRTPLAETLGFLDEAQQPVLATLPSTFDHLSMVLVPTFGSYTSLSLAEQESALNDWIMSPLAFRRQVGQALRQLVLAHAYAIPSVAAEIGYAGPLIGRVDLPVHPLRFGEPS